MSGGWWVGWVAIYSVICVGGGRVGGKCDGAIHCVICVGEWWLVGGEWLAVWCGGCGGGGVKKSVF